MPLGVIVIIDSIRLSYVRFDLMPILFRKTPILYIAEVRAIDFQTVKNQTEAKAGYNYSSARAPPTAERIKPHDGTSLYRQ